MSLGMTVDELAAAYEQSRHDIEELVDEIHVMSASMRLLESERDFLREEQSRLLSSTLLQSSVKKDPMINAIGNNNNNYSNSMSNKKSRSVKDFMNGLDFNNIEEEEQDVDEYDMRDMPGNRSGISRVSQSGKDRDRSSNGVIDRIKEMEEMIAALKTTQRALERTSETATRDRNEALADLEKAQLETNLAKEELETERSQRLAMKAEMERVQRQSETAAREVRAAEKRYETVMEEMNHVMKERDDALNLGMRFEKEKENMNVMLNDMRKQLTDAIAKRDAALQSEQILAREKDLLNQQYQNEQRLRLNAARDLEIAQQQLHDNSVEKDTMAKERERALIRLEEAMVDRRNALEARDNEQRRADNVETRVKDLELQLEIIERKNKNLENELNETQKLFDNERQKSAVMELELKEANRKVQAADDDRQNAFQDLEAAQRHIHCLSEELKNSIKLRDKILLNGNATNIDAVQIRAIQSSIPSDNSSNQENRSRDMEMLHNILQDIDGIVIGRDKGNKIKRDVLERDLLPSCLQISQNVLEHLRLQPRTQLGLLTPHTTGTDMQKNPQTGNDRTQILAQIDTLKGQIRSISKNIASSSSSVPATPSSLNYPTSQSGSPTKSDALRIQELERNRVELLKQIEALQNQLKRVSSQGTNNESAPLKARIQELSREYANLLRENGRLKNALENEQHKVKDAYALLRSKEEEINRLERLTEKLGVASSSPSVAAGTQIYPRKTLITESELQRADVAKELEEVCEVLEHLESEFTSSKSRLYNI